MYPRRAMLYATGIGFVLLVLYFIIAGIGYLTGLWYLPVRPWPAFPSFHPHEQHDGTAWDGCPLRRPPFLDRGMVWAPWIRTERYAFGLDFDLGIP